jgi:hypothetical protein
MVALTVQQKTARNDSAVYSSEFLSNVAQGLVPGHELVRRFGAVLGVDTNLTVIASAKTYQTPSTLTSLEILSDDNTNDKAGGSGALTVEIIGIGAGWLEVTQEATLNGTAAVALATQLYRVRSVRVKTSGAYGSASTPSHNSTITIRVASAGATWATINKVGSFGLGKTQIAAYTVPKGKIAFIVGDHISIESGKTASVYRFYRENCDDVTTPYTGIITVDDLSSVAAGSTAHADIWVGPFRGPCDIGYMGNVSSTTANIEVDFDLLVIDA